MSPGEVARRSSLAADVAPSVRNRVLDLGYSYWDSKRIDGRLPGRRDIDPLDIPALLPQVVLLDVRREPWDFRFRLIGTNVVHHLATDLTGTWMSEISHMSPPSRIFNACVEVAAFGTPQRSETPYVGPHQNYVRAEDIILPLAADGSDADMLLVFVEHFPKD